MKVKVRTHPINVYYLTDEDALAARSEAHGEDEATASPCFTTEMYGEDGFAWATCESFEFDYRLTFGLTALPVEPTAVVKAEG